MLVAFIEQTRQDQDGIKEDVSHAFVFPQG